MTPRILIVAGSDSGGGAGIQADIKTVTMLGGHAMTAITAVTAQNTVGVQAVHAVPTDIVIAQMRSCIDDIGVDAVKIGMIGSAATAHAVADVLETLSPYPLGEGSGWGVSKNSAACGHPLSPTPPLKGRGVPIIFDPVMVATSGSILADAQTIDAFARLMALANVVTPNTPELSTLSGIEVIDEISQSDAAERIMQQSGCQAILAKGGHLRCGGYTLGKAVDGTSFRYDNIDRVFDSLYELDGNGWRERVWDNDRLDTPHTHGTGCTLASAIATGLGAGLDLPAAIERAIAFVRVSLEHAPGLGRGHGPMGQQFATGFACPT